MTSERKKRLRVLDPFERFAEVIFGLIMVLTFTGSLSIATAGHQEIRTMIIGAIGCNAAWGIIDAVLYVLGGFLWNGRAILVLKAVRKPGEDERARELIADALPERLAAALTAADLDSLRERLKRLPEPPARPPVTKRNLIGALAVFLLVFLSTFPVVLPFLFLSNAARALRLSNWVAVALLFLTGFLLGRHCGLRPVLLGVAMAAIGMVLVSLTIALGG